MRMTSNMIWNRPSQIHSSAWGSNLVSRVGQRSAAISKSVSKTSFGSAFNSQLSSYAKIGSAAEDLRSSAAQFAAKNGSLFENARRTGSTANLLDQAKSMINGYNDTVKNLKGSPSALNGTYQKMLENTFRDSSVDLGSIGITVNRDSTVSIDEKKFNSAGIDTIEKVLGSKSGFSSRLTSVSDNINSNAMVNQYSAMSRYGINNYSPYSLYGNSALTGFGNSYLSALMGGKFNFWA